MATPSPPDRRPRLWPQVLGPVVLVAVADGVYFAVSDSPGGTSSAPIAPPGWLVATVWVVLFAGLGYARWLLLGGRSGQLTSAATRTRRLLDLLILLCLAYPLYAIAPDNDHVAFVSNLIVMAFAAWIATLASRIDRRAAIPLIALLCWVAFASAVPAQSLGWLPS